MLQVKCSKRLSSQEFPKSGCMSDLTIYFQAHPSPDELEYIGEAQESVF